MPLLVLVIPDDDGARLAHGQLLGALLNHGGDARLATLALATVVCAGPSELRALVPAATVATDTWALLVETDRVPASTRAFGGAAPVVVAPVGADWDAQEKAADRALTLGIAWLGDGLVKLLATDRGMLVRRVAQGRSANPGAYAAAEAALASGPLSMAVAADAPARVALAAADATGDARSALIAPLAAAARATLVQERVQGSYWAVSGGCGTVIEGEPTVMVDCGMGHVTERARRALYFWNPKEAGY